MYGWLHCISLQTTFKGFFIFGLLHPPSAETSQLLHKQVAVGITIRSSDRRIFMKI